MDVSFSGPENTCKKSYGVFGEIVIVEAVFGGPVMEYFLIFYAGYCFRAVKVLRTTISSSSAGTT